jgi:ABC-type glycerol-3-phosphate transport system substrate-binding protein
LASFAQLTRATYLHVLPAGAPTFRLVPARVHKSQDTHMTKKRFAFPFLVVLSVGFSALAQQKTVTIATVNNPAMIELKKLSPTFETENPNIKLNWVVVEENILRQRVTTDISTGSGQFDLVFIGLYETPIFAKRGWLKEMVNIPSDYAIPKAAKNAEAAEKFALWATSKPYIKLVADDPAQGWATVPPKK